MLIFQLSEFTPAFAWCFQKQLKPCQSLRTQHEYNLFPLSRSSLYSGTGGYKLIQHKRKIKSSTPPMTQNKLWCKLEFFQCSNNKNSLYYSLNYGYKNYFKNKYKNKWMMKYMERPFMASVRVPLVDCLIKLSFPKAPRPRVKTPGFRF